MLFIQAKVLGAFKLARFAYDRLQRQRVPPFWQDQIDLDMLTVQVTTRDVFFQMKGLPFILFLASI